MRLLLLFSMVGCVSPRPTPSETSPASSFGLRDLPPGMHAAYTLDNQRHELEVNGDRLVFDGQALARVGIGHYEYDDAVEKNVEECPNGEPGHTISTVEIWDEELTYTVAQYMGCEEGDTSSPWASPYVRSYRFNEVPEAERCQRATYLYDKEDGCLQQLELEVACDGTIVLQWVDSAHPLRLSTFDGLTYEGTETFMTHPPFVATARVRWEPGAERLELLAYETEDLWFDLEPPRTPTGAYRLVPGMEPAAGASTPTTEGDLIAVTECERFATRLRECLGSLTDETKGVLDEGLLAKMAAAWNQAIAAGDPPAKVCQSTLDTAKEVLGKLCPSVSWQ